MPGDIIVHNHFSIEATDILRKLERLEEQNNHIIKHQHQMANSIADLTAKVDALQTALDEKQAAIAAAIAALKELVVVNGTEAERQTLSDKIDAIFADVVSTPTE